MVYLHVSVEAELQSLRELFIHRNGKFPNSKPVTFDCLHHLTVRTFYKHPRTERSDEASHSFSHHTKQPQVDWQHLVSVFKDVGTKLSLHLEVSSQMIICIKFVQWVYIYFYVVSSHAVNLLNNLPVSCLDVLIDVPSQEGQEKYGGKNMDAVQKLLDFMEKRLNKVKFRPSTAKT